MVRQHQQLNGHESEQISGDSKGQASLACCSPWGHKVGHDLATEQQHEIQNDYMATCKKMLDRTVQSGQEC